MYDPLKNIDAREIELPETVFIRDIETRVFQAIALQCLAKIGGIALIEGNLFDSLLGRDLERVKGIHVEQDQKKHSVDIRAEINIEYGSRSWSRRSAIGRAFMSDRSTSFSRI